MAISVAGVIKKNNLYLLGKRKTGGSIGGKWEFPGGKVETGEDLKSALAREFTEELDVDIIVKDFICLVHFIAEDHSFELNAFYVELVSDNIINNEHDEFSWFTLNDIKKLSDSFADSDKLILKYL